MKKKKICAALLAGTMLFTSVTGCGQTSAAPEDELATEEVTAGTEESGDTNGEIAAPASYDEDSSKIYDAALGEFYDTYMQAKDQSNTISERYAKMAVSEAKLLEACVMLPSECKGAGYAISRVAPHTATPILWGNDESRWHQYLVTTDPIAKEDIAAMREKYNELKGTGTYEDWAKSYLEEKGYTLKDSYNYNLYTSDPTTWDVLSTSQAADTEPLVNTYDGLMEYDIEGEQQPALAESYSVSDDGLTYTFKIRQGVEWVDSQGRKVADVVADDFVAGMQHALDCQGGLEYLVDGVIDGVTEYISGEITDFSKVGIKAVDDYTLEYTLTEPCSYFTSMLGYGLFAPLSRTYYTSQGGKFGTEFNSSASDYNYGKSPDSIAYCGPYLITNYTSKNTIVFKANDTYWNKDNINIHTITWVYEDQSDDQKSYNNLITGVVDGAGLTTTMLEMAKQDGNFDKYAYISSSDATTYASFYNLNRNAFANMNDSTAAVSEKTDEENKRTTTAMQNVHFRRAITFATDRPSMLAHKKGEDLKLNALRNSYTPGNFVTLPEDVTIDINGTATDFAAGTQYGAIVQAQIDADGFPAKVYDPTANNGEGGSDGFDGWYNPEEAVKELDTAISELAEEGVTIDEEHPIYIDFPNPSNVEVFNNMHHTYKQSIEAALGGKVIINLVDCKDADEWYYTGYYADYGYQGNYDTYDVSGWGPDYGDPATYLDTYLPDYSGYMTKNLGIF